ATIVLRLATGHGGRRPGRAGSHGGLSALVRRLHSDAALGTRDHGRAGHGAGVLRASVGAAACSRPARGLDLRARAGLGRMALLAGPGRTSGCHGMGGERSDYGRRADRDHARSSSGRFLYGLSNSKSLISFFRYFRSRLMIFSSNWRARSREMLYFFPLSSSVIAFSAGTW